MLHPETQTILDALQPLVKTEMGRLLRLPYHEDGGELFPFVWNRSEQGEFNLWNLLQAEGWSQSTDLEAALESWSLPDRTGVINGATWLLPSDDEAGILLNEPSKTARLKNYQALADWLEANLQDLQVWRLGVSGAERDADAFSAVLVVGQVADGWLGVVPSIPYATPERDFPFQAGSQTSSITLPASAASALEPQLQAILAQLGTIQVYGYYGGGYNQVHDHKLVYAIGASQSAAIEQVLRLAGGTETQVFECFKPKTDQNSEMKQIAQLDQFLHQISPLRLDRICFWNQEYFYISGEISGEQAGDRVGVVLSSRFTYNP